MCVAAPLDAVSERARAVVVEADGDPSAAEAGLDV
jgi:hypothetical protein